MGRCLGDSCLVFLLTYPMLATMDYLISAFILDVYVWVFGRLLKNIHTHELITEQLKLFLR